MVAKSKPKNKQQRNTVAMWFFETQFIAPTASHYYSTIFAGYTTRYRWISQHITDPFCWLYIIPQRWQAVREKLKTFVISIGNLNKNIQKASRIHVVGKTLGGKVEQMKLYGYPQWNHHFVTNIRCVCFLTFPIQCCRHPNSPVKYSYSAFEFI